MGLQDSSVRVWWRGGGGTHMVVSGMFLTRGMLVIRSWKLERIHIVTLVSVLCMTTLGGRASTMFRNPDGLLSSGLCNQRLCPWALKIIGSFSLPGQTVWLCAWL